MTRIRGHFVDSGHATFFCRAINFLGALYWLRACHIFYTAIGFLGALFSSGRSCPRECLIYRLKSSNPRANFGLRTNFDPGRSISQGLKFPGEFAGGHAFILGATLFALCLGEFNLPGTTTHFEDNTQYPRDHHKQFSRGCFDQGWPCIPQMTTYYGSR